MDDRKVVRQHPIQLTAVFSDEEVTARNPPSFQILINCPPEGCETQQILDYVAVERYINFHGSRNHTFAYEFMDRVVRAYASRWGIPVVPFTGPPT